MMAYMEASNKISEWCLAQKEPFSYFDLIHATQDIVDQCEASKEDLVTRALSRVTADGRVILVGEKGKQKYISAETWEAFKKAEAEEKSADEKV